MARPTRPHGPFGRPLPGDFSPLVGGGGGGAGGAGCFRGGGAAGGGGRPPAGPAADELPGAAAGLPQGGEEDARVVGVEADVDGAGVGVLFEDLLPGLAAVGGAVDAA